MMRTYLAALFIMLAAAFQGSAVHAQPKVDIQINIAEILKELSSWVRDYTARSDRLEKEKVSASRVLLIKQLVELSALKKHAAERLKIFASTSSGDSDQLNRLRDSLNNISRKIHMIMGTISEMDPQWVEAHRELFAKATILAYHKQSLIYGKLELRGGDAKSREEAESLAATFEHEAESVAEIANQL